MRSDLIMFTKLTPQVANKTVVDVQNPPHISSLKNQNPHLKNWKLHTQQETIIIKSNKTKSSVILIFSALYGSYLHSSITTSSKVFFYF